MKSSLLRPDSAKKNFVFQLLYQIIILVLPLVVSPYLTRTLGGTSIGVYTYTYSIAYYFVIVAMLGINRHGQRVISQRRGNLLALRKTFWSLYAVHLGASFVALVAYIVYVFCICGSDKLIALVQTIYVSSAIFDLTWLFYGLEKFKMVTIRNAVVRIINAICIFVFVKNPSDVGVYTFIMALTSCMGNIVLFPQVIPALPPIRFSLDDVKEHLKPLFTLFAAAVAISLYTVFDKTLLGILATKEDVAFYEYSDKIINIPKVFISVISTVLYPKACAFAANSEWEKMQRNFKNSLVVTCFIGFASFFGLLAIAEPFAIIYYGEEFSTCGNVIMIMSPLIVIIGIGEVFRLQYIFPLKKDGAMVKIVSLNAIVNVVLSSLLIPFWGISGAVVGTIAAETVGLIIEMWLVRSYFSLKVLATESIPFIFCGAVMFAVIKFIGLQMNESLVSLLILAFVGAVVYCGIYMVYCGIFDKEMLGYIGKTIKNLIQKIKRRK